MTGPSVLRHATGDVRVMMLHGDLQVDGSRERIRRRHVVRMKIVRDDLAEGRVAAGRVQQGRHEVHVVDGRVALPEGNANDHTTAGVLDIWR